MKKIIPSLVMLVLAAVRAVAADHLVLVPARGLVAADVRPALTGVLDHILNRAAPCTMVSVLDPVDRSLRASFAIPVGPARARAANRELKSAIPALKSAFENHPATRNWERGTLALPEIVRFVRERLANPGDRVTLVFIGDPRYRSDSEVFDFTNGCVPGDGWLSADEAESPYATGSDIHALDGWGIFLATMPVQWAASEWQRTEIERFWTLYAQRQGAGLLLGDVNLVLAKLGQGIPRNASVRVFDPVDQALVFRSKVFVRGQSVEVTQKINADVPAVAEPPVAEPDPAPAVVAPTPASATIPLVVEQQIVASPITQTALVAAPQSAPADLVARLDSIPRGAPGKMVVSLVWDNEARKRADCDIDAWLTIEGVPGELNYRNKKLPEKGPLAASLRKDITDARGLKAAGVDFEQVTIHQPVSPEAVTLWLNVFNNRSRSPITVVLRLEYQGQIYLKTLHFPALAGDGASGRKNRAGSPHWQRVDLALLVRETKTASGQSS